MHPWQNIVWNQARQKPGFSLSEILIALVILGVLAVFTLPKVLSNQNNSWNARAREAAMMLDGAYKAYQTDNLVTAATTGRDLTPYLNYVKLETGAFQFIDNNPPYDSLPCTAANPCAKMHNGGAFFLASSDSFGSTAGTNALIIQFDPDGKYSGSATGSGKAVTFLLYFDGRLTTLGYAENNTCTATYCPFGPDPTKDPAWFNWQ